MGASASTGGNGMRKVLSIREFFPNDRRSLSRVRRSSGQVDLRSMTVLDLEAVDEGSGACEFADEDGDAYSDAMSAAALAGYQSGRSQTMHMHNCLEFWRATPELLQLPDEERLQMVGEQLLVRSDGPFPDNFFDQKADLTWGECLKVYLFFGVILGGPVCLILALVAAVVIWHWAGLAGWLVATAALASHPLPKTKYNRHSVTLALYKYFSFRMIWSDNLLQDLNGRSWCAAVLPHGVFPQSALLCGLACNTFLAGSFIGATASVVHWTPFLRYVKLLGHTSDVCAKSIKRHTANGSCVAIVADGIAGIFTGQDEAVLKERKGLAKLSLESDVPIVPVWSFGNTDTFTVVADSCGVMMKISRMLKVSLFAFFGAIGPIPRRANVTAVFGPAVIPPAQTEKPEREDIDMLHEAILSSFRTAFNRHKAECGIHGRELTFL